ncbi:hypothetical protein [Rhizobium sp. SAFR-030]|uniref:hypothetical protein n=1 Tax=Rhizobium sp. SAFR-030 TaxID=3387277 RepID=UPI003F7D25FC
MSDRRFFELSTTWPPSRNKSDEETAEIGIRLGYNILTRVADFELGTNRDFFRASATTLALWFVENAWRLRYETLHDPRYPSVDWRLSHDMTSVGAGLLWPPAMIYGSGERVIFAPSVGPRTNVGAQQFLEVLPGSVIGRDFDDELERFFSKVIDHHGNRASGEELIARVARWRDERVDPDFAGWRRLEAALGYNIDAAPENLLEHLIKLESLVGESGIEEAAASSPGAQSASTLSTALEATQNSPLQLDFAVIEGVNIDASMSNAHPWQLAEAAAANVRQKLGLRSTPLLNRDFAQILNVNWQTIKDARAIAADLPYAARLMGKGELNNVALQTTHQKDRRFELARMLGDAIWSGDAKFGLVSRAKTDRQKFQRAFAQSLLCPYDALKDSIDMSAPSDVQIAGAAQKFHVRESVITSLLAYKGVLQFENLEQRLEAA